MSFSVFWDSCFKPGYDIGLTLLQYQIFGVPIYTILASLLAFALFVGWISRFNGVGGGISGTIRSFSQGSARRAEKRRSGGNN